MAATFQIIGTKGPIPGVTVTLSGVTEDSDVAMDTLAKDREIPTKLARLPATKRVALVDGRWMLHEAPVKS